MEFISDWCEMLDSQGRIYTVNGRAFMNVDDEGTLGFIYCSQKLISRQGRAMKKAVGMVAFMGWA